MNDLMVKNPFMTIPPINYFPVMAVPTKTSTTRNDNVFKMDTDSATTGIDNRCSLCISQIAESVSILNTLSFLGVEVLVGIAITGKQLIGGIVIDGLFTIK